MKDEYTFDNLTAEQLERMVNDLLQHRVWSIEVCDWREMERLNRPFRAIQQAVPDYKPQKAMLH